MTATVRSAATRRKKLISPNDPRWDIRIGMPINHLVQVIACRKAAGKAEKEVKS